MDDNAYLNKIKGLVVTHVTDTINAAPRQLTFFSRAHEKNEIKFDVFVLWEREDMNDNWPRFGTHQGTVYEEGGNLRVSIFWGHYDLDKVQAEQDYELRMSSFQKLYPIPAPIRMGA